MADYIGRQTEEVVTREVRVSFDEFDPKDFIDAINMCLANSNSTKVRIMQEIQGGEYLVAFKPTQVDEGCFTVMVQDPADVFKAVTEAVQCWDQDWRGIWDMTPSRDDGEVSQYAMMTLVVTFTKSDWKDAGV